MYTYISYTYTCTHIHIHKGGVVSHSCNLTIILEAEAGGSYKLKASLARAETQLYSDVSPSLLRAAAAEDSSLCHVPYIL